MTERNEIRHDFFKYQTMRKEIELKEEVIKKLQKQADKMGLKLKPYMEFVLVNIANLKNNPKP